MSRTSVLTAGTALLCTLLICSCSVTKKMQEQLKELPFPAVDMAHVKDGTYTGMAETLLVQADVSVEIIGGHIRQINPPSYKRQRKKSRNDCKHNESRKHVGC